MSKKRVSRTSPRVVRGTNTRSRQEKHRKTRLSTTMLPSVHSRKTRKMVAAARATRTAPLLSSKKSPKTFRQSFFVREDAAILYAAFIGLIIALYAITLHYSPSSSSFCNINETFNCDKVNKSPWALLFGIPVAILGFLSYAFLFFAVLKRRRIMRTLDFTAGDVSQYLLLLVVVMLGFQIYLTGVELFVIKSYCLVCLASQACILMLVWLVGKEYRMSKEFE